MDNFLQKGCVLTLTAPYTVVAGAGTLVGSIFGVAANDTTSGAQGEYQTEGVFSLAKVSAQAWTQGALIYWDDTAKLCTTTVATNKLIGVAIAAAANPTSVGSVRLNGAFVG